MQKHKSSACFPAGILDNMPQEILAPAIYKIYSRAIDGSPSRNMRRNIKAPLKTPAIRSTLPAFRAARFSLCLVRGSDEIHAGEYQKRRCDLLPREIILPQIHSNH